MLPAKPNILSRRRPLNNIIGLNNLSILRTSDTFNPKYLRGLQAMYDLKNSANYFTTTANFTGTGTATSTLISTAFVGVSTIFLSELAPGDTVYNSSDVLIGTILSVTNDTNAVLTSNGAVAITGTAYHIIKANPRLILVSDISGNSSTNAFVSSGAASNTATAPTASITGNQTLTADVMFNDYTPGTNHTLFSKTSGNNGIEWLLLTTGVLRLRIGDGAAVTNFDSTVANTITDLTRATVQAVYVDNASVIFNVNGVQLGTTVTVNKVLTNAATTATIGTTAAGVIYSVTIGSVYNFNPSGAAKLAASFVAPTTGETWTINTSGDLGAHIGGARDLVQLTAGKQSTILSGSATFDGVNDYMKANPWVLVQPETLYFVGKQVTWTNNDALFDGNTTDSMEILQELTTPKLRALAGTFSNELTTFPLATNGVLSVVFNGASSSLRLNRTTAITGNFGASNGSGFTLGSTGGAAGNFANIFVNEALIYSTAQSTATNNQVITYLAQRWGISL